MTNYRRSRIAGASYFFTVNLADRSQSLLTDHIAEVRSAFIYTRERHPFTVDAIVVLPEHIHAIWTLPEGDRDFALRWRLIKTVFSRGLPHVERRTASRESKGERGIWQRRYWEHLIRDEADFSRHFDYIHINPVKHGLVSHVADWPHSSFHRYVKAGMLPMDWACGIGEDVECGERPECRLMGIAALNPSYAGLLTPYFLCELRGPSNSAISEPKTVEILRSTPRDGFPTPRSI